MVKIFFKNSVRDKKAKFQQKLDINVSRTKTPQRHHAIAIDHKLTPLHSIKFKCKTAQAFRTPVTCSTNSYQSM